LQQPRSVRAAAARADQRLPLLDHAGSAAPAPRSRMSPAGMRVELITRRSDIPLDAERWNALVADNEINTVFQTYEWFDSWWQVFGKGRELFFLVVREGDEIVGFA